MGNRLLKLCVNVCGVKLADLLVSKEKKGIFTVKLTLNINDKEMRPVRYFITAFQKNWKHWNETPSNLYNGKPDSKLLNNEPRQPTVTPIYDFSVRPAEIATKYLL